MSYVGMAKRIASSFFPQAVPVPQLQPLDARKIFYASDEEVWKVTLVWAEASSSDNEWTAFLAWEDASSSDEAWAAFLEREEAKVQEREAKTVKAVSPSGDYDIYDPSTWPPYVWPAQPAAVRCKKPYDEHLASLLAAQAAAKAPAPTKKNKPSLFGDDDDWDEILDAIAKKRYARESLSRMSRWARAADEKAMVAEEKAKVAVEKARVARVAVEKARAAEAKAAAWVVAREAAQSAF